MRRGGGPRTARGYGKFQVQADYKREGHDSQKECFIIGKYNRNMQRESIPLTQYAGDAEYQETNTVHY